MKLRNLMYGAIFVICIISIVIGIYTEITKETGYYGKTKHLKSKNVVIENKVEEPKTQEPKTEEKKYANMLKQDFLKIFDNKVHKGTLDVSKVKKAYGEKDIVYTGLSLIEEKDNYNFNIEVPWINIDSEVADNYNKNSQKVFVDKITEIMTKSKDKTIYDISYTVYVYDNIMSVLILCNLKEGTNAQRDMVSSYNYNLETEQDLTLKDAINILNKDNDEISKNIKNAIKDAAQEQEALKAAGYNVFERNVNNELYKIENSNTFYIDNNGNLNIIYAYGNDNVTSEMDIISIL